MHCIIIFTLSNGAEMVFFVIFKINYESEFPINYFNEILKNHAYGMRHTFDKSAEKAPRVKARKKHAANAPLSCVLSVVFDSISTKIVAFCVEIGAIELESNIVAI